MELKFANHGQLRDVNATEGEKELAAYVLNRIAAAGFDPSRVELIRRSDYYVTLASGKVGFIRFKVTDRAKWFMFVLSDLGGTKRRFSSLEDLDAYDFVGEYKKFAEFCEKYGVD